MLHEPNYFREKAAIDDASRSEEALAVLTERLASGSPPRCVDLGAGTLSLLPTIAKAIQKAGFTTFEFGGVAAVGSAGKTSGRPPNVSRGLRKLHRGF